MVAQLPVIAEKPLTTCGCRKFQLDPLGDHLNTCTAHSGAKKAHDWMVDQIADFFRTHITSGLLTTELGVVLTLLLTDI
jgi:hypothetical protein